MYNMMEVLEERALNAQEQSRVYTPQIKRAAAGCGLISRRGWERGSGGSVM